MRYSFRFTKYHGCGNDFLLRDERQGPTTPDRDRGALAARLCDRHFWVGADGILFLDRAEGADGSMRLFEPAGNEADMCGNGVRCVADHLSRELGKRMLRIRTRDGVKEVVRAGASYRVRLGPVRMRRADLRPYFADGGKDVDRLLGLKVRAGDEVLHGALVNSGEPHLVVPTDDLAGTDVHALGRGVNESVDRFPLGVNVDFVEPLPPHALRLRTYERGVNCETLACGTGAAASCAVALLLGWIKPGPAAVLPPGGTVWVEMADDGTAYLTGPATRVFEGVVDIEV